MQKPIYEKFSRKNKLSVACHSHTAMDSNASQIMIDERYFFIVLQSCGVVENIIIVSFKSFYLLDVRIMQKVADVYNIYWAIGAQASATAPARSIISMSTFETGSSGY